MRESRHPPISVVLGELHDLAGVGLRSEIEADPQFQVHAADVNLARLSTTIADFEPSVAVIDDVGLGYVRRIHEAQPGAADTGLVVLVGSFAKAEGYGFDTPGRVVCLSKQLPIRTILAALVLTAEGMRVSTVPELTSLGLLTDRERQVYVLLREGKSNAQIALALHIGVETVKTHVHSILGKFGVRSRVELRDAV